MDKPLLDKFSGLLDGSLGLLNDLKNIAEEEKNAIVACKYNELASILSKRDLTLDEFQKTINELESIFPKLAKSKSEKISNLGELCKYIDEPYLTFFKAFPEKFQALVKVIHEANIRNLIVLNHCKELIYEFLCIIAKKGSPCETYSSMGRIQKTMPPSFITSNL